FVLLDGKCLEPPLPYMPAAAVVLVIPPHVRRLQPLHPAAEIAVGPRPEHKVEMIGHQAISQHAHWAAGVRLVKQPHERRIVRRLMKNLLPGVPPIEDM